MQQTKQQFIMITGPTGVGKSELATLLAQEVNGEIVNADIGQFYAPFAVGTAKPDWRNESVPHHLFDICNAPENYTVAQYRTLVLNTMNELWSRGATPILVGGSGFYLRSLLWPPLSPPTQQPLSQERLPRTWQALNAIDPERARVISPHDPYRIDRALTIWEQTGIKPSSLQPVYEPPAPFRLIILSRDRQDLYQRINERTLVMLKTGWIEEVERVRGTTWEQFLRDKGLIGYDDVLSYLEGAVSHDTMVGSIQQKTRHYAKRQETYMRMLIRSLLQEEGFAAPCGITRVNLTLLDHGLYISQLIKQISTGFM